VSFEPLTATIKCGDQIRRS